MGNDSTFARFGSVSDCFAGGKKDFVTVCGEFFRGLKFAARADGEPFGFEVLISFLLVHSLIHKLFLRDDRLGGVVVTHSTVPSGCSRFGSQGRAYTGAFPWQGLEVLQINGL